MILLGRSPQTLTERLLPPAGRTITKPKIPTSSTWTTPGMIGIHRSRRKRTHHLRADPPSSRDRTSLRSHRRVVLEPALGRSGLRSVITLVFFLVNLYFYVANSVLSLDWRHDIPDPSMSDGIPWPAMTQTAPSKLSNLMAEWERSLSPSPNRSPLASPPLDKDSKKD